MRAVAFLLLNFKQLPFDSDNNCCVCVCVRHHRGVPVCVGVCVWLCVCGSCTKWLQYKNLHSKLRNNANIKSNKLALPLQMKIAIIACLSLALSSSFSFIPLVNYGFLLLNWQVHQWLQHNMQTDADVELASGGEGGLRMNTISIWERWRRFRCRRRFKLITPMHMQQQQQQLVKEAAWQGTLAPLCRLFTRTHRAGRERTAKVVRLPRVKMLRDVAACWGNIRCRLATVKSHQQRATTATMMLC